MSGTMKTTTDLKVACIKESLESAKRQGKAKWVVALEQELAEVLAGR